MDATFFEGAAYPAAFFCAGFYLAGDEPLATGDEQADVVAGADGERVCHGWGIYLEDRIFQ